MGPGFALHRGWPLSAEEERTGFSGGPGYDELAANLADFIENKWHTHPELTIHERGPGEW